MVDRGSSEFGKSVALIVSDIPSGVASRSSSFVIVILPELASISKYWSDVWFNIEYWTLPSLP